MKTAVEQAGLRVPRFLPLTRFVEQAGAAPWTGATVLKPHKGASSVDVVVFDDAAKAYEAVTGRRSGVRALDESDARDDFEVEEFVDGPILHFDGLVQDGELLVVGASEYVGTCLAYAQGAPMGSFQIDCTADRRDWVARVLDAVRIHHGSFHLEAIVNQDELVFLEVGNRVGGADVVATFELATGVHLPSYELRILLGDAVRDEVATVPGGRSYGWFVHPGHHLGPGVFAGFAGADAFRDSPELVTWHELPIGAALPDHITYGAGETALAGVAVTDSPEDTRRWMVSLFQALQMRTGATAPV
jgi:hypothetical protein